MSATAWIVVVQRYAGADNNGLNIHAPIATNAIQLAKAILARDPTVRVVFSSSLLDTKELSALPASVNQTGATQVDLQNALKLLHGNGPLLLYWIGHGIQVQNSRQLLCADSSGRDDLRAVDVDSLLARLRDKSFPRTQIGFFDACAQVMAQASSLNLGTDGSIATDQFFYFSASATEAASSRTTASGKVSEFSDLILDALTDPDRPFPPEPMALFEDLHRQFKDLHLSTRAFPLMWTERSGETWSRLVPPQDLELAQHAAIAHCSVGEFEHLTNTISHPAKKKALSRLLCEALHEGRVDTLLTSEAKASQDTP